MAKAKRSTAALNLEAMDLLDDMTLRAAMLDAQTMMIAGSGFEAFDSLNDDLKEHYLAAVTMAASDLRALIGKLSVAITR